MVSLRCLVLHLANSATRGCTPKSTVSNIRRRSRACCCFSCPTIVDPEENLTRVVYPRFPMYVSHVRRLSARLRGTALKHQLCTAVQPNLRCITAPHPGTSILSTKETKRQSVALQKVGVVGKHPCFIERFVWRRAVPCCWRVSSFLSFVSENTDLDHERSITRSQDHKITPFDGRAAAVATTRTGPGKSPRKRGPAYRPLPVLRRRRGWGRRLLAARAACRRPGRA